MSTLIFIHKSIVYLGITHANFHDHRPSRTIVLEFSFCFGGSHVPNSDLVLCKQAYYITLQAVYMIIIIDLGLFQYSMCSEMQWAELRTNKLTRSPVRKYEHQRYHKKYQYNRLFTDLLYKTCAIGVFRCQWIILVPFGCLTPYQLLNISIRFVR